LVLGHTYVGGGDTPEVKQVPGGLLGADYAIEHDRYRFARVYQGENWNPELRAPLTEPGVNVKAGDYLLAVSDRHGMDGLFDVSLCTEEFGVGSAGEMLEEIMHHAGVNPSETLVLGTRSPYFEAAHALDIMTIGCGWGLRHPQDSAGADLEALTVSHVCAAVEQADQLATDYLP